MSLQQHILNFIENREKINESTTIRHIHRRFDLDYDHIENILNVLLDNNLITKYYDKEFDEDRFTPVTKKL